MHSSCICYYDFSYSHIMTQYANRNPVHFNNFDHIFSNVFSVLVYCFLTRALFQFNSAIILKTRNENKILQFFCNCYYICLFANCAINSCPNYCLHGDQTQTGLLTHSNFPDLLRVGTKGNNFSVRRMSGCALLPVVLRPLILTELRLSNWDPADVRGL